ncbi:HNH endonuclease [Arthrobacter gengyunqii]|uniref:HNH endonuclease n=1 Tax=Arthrobacter gengyunqii TaxID=2886940 RepID=A0A9X1M0U9_9MICC|nr:HNH endonuclease signature motif containing protein [Arthrobacter gengyunqii]MCC3265871.1 HNH endonuclease [Arthrobacter gengyunqii]MCC3268627.1 HNH endonuclease [Arthrobacter gengyunqii]UOY96015.1 HNH endonuclease [Arthrobacter gengyunqii]
MDQNGSSRLGGTGDFTGAGQAAGASLSVYEAESGTAGSPRAQYDPAQVSHPGPTYREGFTGSLALQSAESLTQDEAGAVLSRLDSLMRWAQAQQAKVLHRMETVFRDDLLQDIGREDPGLTFSLAAEEAAAILHLPTNTAKMLMSDAGQLCSTHTTTLAGLEEGTLSYGHVQTVLDQSQNVPEAELASFEKDLLEMAAAGQTPSKFRVKARRMREKTYPETISVRHKTAFEQRRVCLAPDEDGMSWLSALLPAVRAQLIYTQLTTAARGEQAAGDPRLVDALRADILADLLEGEDAVGDTGGDEGGDVHDNRVDDGLDNHPIMDTRDNGGTKDAKARARARTEILVLINAETLFGADEQPAELHGYGPISPETARRLARQAAHWTPVERHPGTDEILRVGRRRKVPAGLQRWLRARDGTCRFPGCRTNAVISELDHTKPWSHGGTTDHDNLEHLCRRHHMFKTRGFWKARQHRPGIIEWTSPGGRTYRTDPHLALAPDHGTVPGKSAGRPGAVFVSYGGTVSENPNDYGDDPPPF